VLVPVSLRIIVSKSPRVRLLTTTETVWMLLEAVFAFRIGQRDKTPAPAL